MAVSEKWMKDEDSRRWRLIAIGGAGILLIAAFLPRPETDPEDRAVATSSSPFAAGAGASHQIAKTLPSRLRLSFSRDAAATRTAEEIVCEKVRQFGQNRRSIALRIAARANRELPPEIEAFFGAIEKGDWEEIHNRWRQLAIHTHQYEYSKDDRSDLEPYWATVLDAYGVAEQAHEWPAQKLLDYGNAILGSLRPGMVYVGGTDNGRWAPTLLNETGSDPHIIITQNALADGTYLEYVRELYGDRFNTLSQEDSQRAFQEYTTDAQKRLQHDLDFPGEPKQVRPGENIKMTDGQVQVSGVVAVMAINEKLLQSLMQKNPDLSFAMQESQPLPGMYADAVPLGPLMELGAQDAQTTFTPERAAQTVDYWREIAQNVLGDPEASASTYALKAWSHDIDSTANLLAAHNYNTEAEQIYRLSSQLWPGNPQAAAGLSTILDRTGRTDEARQLLDDFARKFPDQLADLKRFAGSVTFEFSAPKQ